MSTHEHAHALYLHQAIKLLITMPRLPFSKYMASVGMAHVAATEADELTLNHCLSSVGNECNTIIVLALLAKLLFYC